MVLADKLVSPRALTPDFNSAFRPALEVYWISEGTVPHAWHRQGNAYWLNAGSGAADGQLVTAPK